VKIIVDISDARVSHDLQDTLITYSLGSCIGVSVYDPVAKIGGMLHYQLPSGKTDPEKSAKSPLMFADTGMEILMKKMFELGATKKNIKVKLAGGAQMMNDAQTFQIGKRNYAAIRQILWKNGMFIEAEDVGGNAPRNMTLFLETGAVEIKSHGNVKML